MHHTSKPTLKQISENEASDDVKQIFEEVKKLYNFDFVPQEYQVAANNPELLRENWETEKALYEGKMGVDPKMMDVIGLAVAASRSCSYCINWHTTALKARGMSDQDILNLMNVIALFNAYAAFTSGLQLTPDVTTDLADKMSGSPMMQVGKGEMKEAA